MLDRRKQHKNFSEHEERRKKDRRQHHRLPVVEGLVEPINLRYALPGEEKSVAQPAVMTNLSAGGMLIVTFMEPPHSKRFEMDLNIPGLHHVPIEGQILRVHSKGEVHTVAIAFVKISDKDKHHISRMAQDYTDCETRISLNLPEACVPTCQCHPLCTKIQKAPHWPPRA